MKTYNVALNIIKKYRRYFLGNMITNFVFFILPLLTTLIISEIFNNLQGFPYTDFSVTFLIWSIPFIFAVRVIAIIGAAIMGWSFGLSAQTMLRRNMINGIYDKPAAAALPSSSGEAISRFRGDAQTFAWFCNFIAVMISFAVFGVSAMILMISINLRVTLLVLIPYILLIALVIFLRGKLQEYQKQRRKDTAIVTSNIGEIFSSVQALKVTASEKHILNHFDRINNNRKNSSVKDELLNSSIRSLYNITVSIATGILLFSIVEPISSGAFTLGEFFIFTFLLGWLAGFLGNVAEVIAWYQRSDVSVERMAQLLSTNGKDELDEEISKLIKETEIYTKSEPPDLTSLDRTSHESLQELRIEGLTYIFKNSDEGIEDVSITIPRKSFTVITGRVGSGKTTLVRTIQGLYKPQSGKIYYNSRIVDNPGDFFQSPLSAYTPQEPRLFSETIKENLLMGLPQSSVDIDKALNLAVVNEDVEEFDDGIDTIIGPKGVKLSGGQKQRVAAARMFIREPEILFMDDISSALDVETEKLLWQRVFNNNTDTTVIAVSHRKSVLKQADQVILMEKGKVKGVGDLDDLLEQHNEMQDIFNEGDLQSIETQIFVPPFDYFEINEIERKFDELKYVDTKAGPYVYVNIPNVWRLTIVEDEIQELISQIIDDDKITQEEFKMLKSIMTNLNEYGRFLEEELQDGVINEEEKEKLLYLRQLTYKEAETVAKLDDIISNDEKAILKSLTIILESLENIEED